MKLIKIIQVLSVLLLGAHTVYGQAQVTGPTTVSMGQTATYTLSGGLASFWTCQGCTITSQDINAATVTWQQTGTLSAMHFKTEPTTINVTVNGGCAGFQQVYPTVTQTPVCENITLSYSTIPPAGTSYYWQTTADGTSTTHSAASYQVTAGTYYLRAKVDSCWATNSLSITAQGQQVPAQPNAPLLLGDCGGLGMAMDLNNPAVAGITYYWQSAPTGTAMTNSGAIHTVLTAGDYFVRARNNATGCWSPASEGLYVAPNSANQLEQPPVAAELINVPDGSAVTETATGINVPSFTQTSLGNYVRTYELQVAGKDELTNFSALAHSEAITTTQYLDGIGRPIQTIQKAVSPNGMDVVSFHNYDELGRELRQYLPYAATSADGAFKTNAPQQQHAFYQTAAQVAHTDWAFAELEYEASARGRVLSQAAAGKSWVGSGRKVTTSQRINLETDQIRFWELETVNDDFNPISPAVYVDGALVVEEITDEQGNTNQKFTDQEGRVVLTRTALGANTYAQTYYVYDSRSKLRFVLPPQAVKVLAENAWVLDQDSEKLIFKYRYDDRGRLVEKWLPSQNGSTKMLYDAIDRLVLTQTPAQAQANQWNYTKYDALDRPIATGIYTTSSNELALRSQLSSETAYETLLASGDYSDVAFPNASSGGSIEEHSVTYYDHYDAVDLNTHGFRTVTATGFVNGQPSDRTDGLLIATKVKVLDGTNRWLWTVNHYDKRGRVIQTIGDNHLNGADVISTQFDPFNSRVLKTHLSHATSTESVEVLKWFSYDHAGRVLASYYQINNQAPELLAAFSYNELGKVVTKRLGNNLQKIDYAYNIRGWLTKINGLDLENSETSTNEPKDLWGMELAYDQGFTKGQYNGNISGAKWTSARDENVHAYGYQYDPLNRLVQADYRYQAENTSLWTNQAQDFTVFGIAYDLNGNILALNRQGAKSKDVDGNWVFGAMDRLVYHYEGNTLKAVDDFTITEQVAGDYSDGGSLYCATGMDEYLHDVNGNLTSDANKGLQAISYNHLNLPTEVQTDEGRVVYTYDAAGVKLKKEVYHPDNSLKSSTDYVGEFVYNQDGLAFIHHEEGRLLPQAASVDSVFKFEYHYKDHLGNLRLSFRAESAEYEVTMETANATAEEARFENVSETRLVGAGAHTGTAVAQLNGGNASRTMGPATVMSVNKGDNIELSVYSKFNSSDLDVSLNPTPQLGSAGNGGIEGGTGVFASGGAGVLLTPIINQVTSGQPQAYARIVIVDEDGNELQEQFELINHTANIYNSLNLQLAIEHDGYAVVYLANESMMDVFFDELNLKHERLVWQENSYYPFGMAIKPLDKEGEPNHGFTYNGKELEEMTDMLEYGQRDYDPQLGRFHKVDRFSEKYYYLTPYNYVNNNPINAIDINGDYIYILINDQHVRLDDAFKMQKKGKFDKDDDSSIAINNLLNGFKTLSSTSAGAERIEQYSGKGHDIYFGIVDGTKFANVGGTAGQTFNKAKRDKNGNYAYDLENPYTNEEGKIDSNFDVFSVFTKQKVENTKVKNEFIAINKSFLLGKYSALFAGADQYDHAELIYHEVTAHITLRDKYNGVVVKDDGKMINYHKEYGKSSPMIERGKARSGSPAEVIINQLKRLKAKNND